MALSTQRERAASGSRPVPLSAVVLHGALALSACSLANDLDSLAGGGAGTSGGSSGNGGAIASADGGWPDGARATGGTIAGGAGGTAGTAGGAGGTGADACVAKSCAETAAECGFIDDGCGAVQPCGSCPDWEICGQGSKANQCMGVAGTWQVLDSFCGADSVFDPTVAQTFTLTEAGAATDLSTDSDCTSSSTGTWSASGPKTLTFTFVKRSCAPDGCILGSPQGVACTGTAYSPPVVLTVQYHYLAWDKVELLVVAGNGCSNQKLSLKRL